MATFIACIGNSDLQYENQRLHRHEGVKALAAGTGFRFQLKALAELEAGNPEGIQTPLIDALVNFARKTNGDSFRLLLVLTDQESAAIEHRANDSVAARDLLLRIVQARHGIEPVFEIYTGNVKDRGSAFAFFQGLAGRLPGPLYFNHTPGVNDMTQAAVAALGMSRSQDQFHLLETLEPDGVAHEHSWVRESHSVPLERAATLHRVLQHAQAAVDFATMAAAVDSLGHTRSAPLARLAIKLAQMQRFEIGRFLADDPPSADRFQPGLAAHVESLRDVHTQLKSLYALAGSRPFSGLDAPDRLRMIRGGCALAAFFLFNLQTAQLRDEAGMLLTLLAAAHEKALAIAASLASGYMLLPRSLKTGNGKKGAGGRDSQAAQTAIPDSLGRYAGKSRFWTKEASISLLQDADPGRLAAMKPFEPGSRLLRLRNASPLEHGLTDVSTQDLSRHAGRDGVESVIRRMGSLFEAAIGEPGVQHLQPQELAAEMVDEYRELVGRLIKAPGQ